jgi:hypothetical protein
MNGKLVLLIATVAVVGAVSPLVTSASAETVSYYSSSCGWKGSGAARYYSCWCTPGDSIDVSGSLCTHVAPLAVGRVKANAKRVRSEIKMQAPPQR